MKKVTWGEDPDGCGPRNYFRESLIIDNVKERLEAGKILDAGCGNGSLSRRLAKKGYKVEGIDASKLSIEFLHKKIIENNLQKNLHAQVGSIFKVPFKNSYFDGVVCGEVLEHLEDDRKAIKELFCVLKKNGYCVVTVPAKMEKWDSVDDASEHIRRYTREELVQKFEKEGFSVVSSNYWGFPLTNFWHSHIYRPFLEKQMATGFKVTESQGLFAKAMKNEKLVSFFSQAFLIDKIFMHTKLGNSLILVAKK